jgi:predicted negative regulator of RcsB-dependent stress response
MSQRPTIQKPTPLSEPSFRNASADPVMGGMNIPKFSADMQAEVSPEAAPLWNFVVNHAPKIAAGVVAIVIIILAVAAVQWYREKQIADARSSLGRIISQQDPARRTAALESFLSSAPSSLEVSALLELAVSATEVQDWDKAAAAYEKAANLEGSSPLAFTARMNHAQILMRKGSCSAAYTEFLSLAGEAPSDVQPVLQQYAGEAAEAAGDKAGAVSCYEAALAALPPSDADSSAFFRSRIAQLKK